MAPEGLLLHRHTLHSATRCNGIRPKELRGEDKKRDKMNLSQQLVHKRPTRLPLFTCTRVNISREKQSHRGTIVPTPYQKVG